MEPESRDHVRQGAALRETAKLAATVPAAPKPPPRRATADSSGFVDLSALMAEQPNWLDNALSRAKAASAGSLPPTTFTPASLAPPALFGGSIAPTLRGLDDEIALGVPRANKSLPLILASSVAGVLITAACIFAIRSSHHTAAATAVAPVVQVAQAAPAVPAIQAPPAAQDDTAVIPPPPPVAATDPNAGADSTDPAPAHAADPESAPTGHHGRHGHHAAAAVAAAEPAEAPAPAAAPAPRQAAAVGGPRSGSALDAALRASMGPASAAPVAAAPAPAAAPAKAAPPPATDGRPERPSGSAVTSALTEVLGAARKCVAQTSGPSRALVTFGSDGNVHKVDVSGPAASDAHAGQCLRSAFNRARVPPFSQSSYAAGVTVRPQ